MSETKMRVGCLFVIMAIAVVIGLLTETQKGELFAACMATGMVVVWVFGRFVNQPVGGKHG